MKYFHRLTVVFVLFFCFQNTHSLFAQTTTITNIGNAKVDNLTDAELQDLMKQAQASGQTDAQIKAMAIARGMSEDNANKLQTRIDALRKNNVTSTNTTTANQGDARQLNYIATGTGNTKEATTALQIFGSELFNNSTITFEPNLRIPTPQNYVLGPDDQLIITVYGNSQVEWKPAISPDGTISIPGIGLINLSGKTIEQANGIIASKLAANHYAIGHGTNVSVTLGNIRSIKVTITGEVVKPSTYTLSSLSTVFGALYLSGGPAGNGSLRQIELIRDNRVIRKIDFYDFLLRGDQKDNIRLQDGDIIRVPTYKVRVSLLGQIKHPAIFEVLPGETLKNVITFAGGFTDLAYTANIKAVQVTDKDRRVTDISAEDFSNYVPLRGDQYTVDKILDRFENRVTINGAVFRPGQFELDKGLTLSQLITKAAGLKEDFSPRGSIIRLKPDNTIESIPFDVKGVVGKTSPDIVLQREDVVTIPSTFDLRDKYKVTITGEVRNGGDFAYADSLSVEDLIIQAGGFTEGASPKRIEIARRVTNSDPSKRDALTSQIFIIDVDATLKFTNKYFVLHPFDIVSVYSLPGFEKQKMVKVEGEVLYAGYYPINTKDEKISSLVQRAGGLTIYADVEGGTLKRVDNLGIDSEKGKVDAAALEADRLDRLKQVGKRLGDSVANVNERVKNDYVGINLKAILEKPGSDIDLRLEEGDVLRIPKQQQLVKIAGEVLFPSSVVFDRQRSLRSYVDNAGGFSSYALKKRVYVLYANGSVKATHHFLFFRSYPQIKPGSEIIVPKKKETKGLSVAESISLLGSLASIGAILLGVLSIVKK